MEDENHKNDRLSNAGSEGRLEQEIESDDDPFFEGVDEVEEPRERHHEERNKKPEETNKRQSPSKQKRQENKGPKQGPEDVEMGEIRGGRQKEEDKPKEGAPVDNAARKAPETKDPNEENDNKEGQPNRVERRGGDRDYGQGNRSGGLNYRKENETEFMVHFYIKDISNSHSKHDTSKKLYKIISQYGEVRDVACQKINNDMYALAAGMKYDSNANYILDKDKLRGFLNSLQKPDAPAYLEVSKAFHPHTRAYKEKEKEREREQRDREREREREREKDKERERDRERERERERERDRERERERERDREREREQREREKKDERDREKERERERERERDRERIREKERERDREKERPRDYERSKEREKGRDNMARRSHTRSGSHPRDRERGYKDDRKKMDQRPSDYKDRERNYSDKNMERERDNERDYEGRGGYKGSPRGQSPYRKRDKGDSIDKRSPERSPRGGNYRSYQKRSPSVTGAKASSRSRSKSPRYQSRNQGYDYKEKEVPRDQNRTQESFKGYEHDRKKARDEPQQSSSKQSGSYRESESNAKNQQYSNQPAKSTTSHMSVEKPPLPERKTEKAAIQQDPPALKTSQSTGPMDMSSSGNISTSFSSQQQQQQQAKPGPVTISTADKKTNSFENCCLLLGIPKEVNENQVLASIKDHGLEAPHECYWKDEGEIQYLKAFFNTPKESLELILKDLKIVVASTNSAYPVMILPLMDKMSIADMLKYHEVQVDSSLPVDSISLYLYYIHYGDIIDIIELSPTRHIITFAKQPKTLQLLNIPEITIIHANMPVKMKHLAVVESCYPITRKSLKTHIITGVRQRMEQITSVNPYMQQQQQQQQQQAKPNEIKPQIQSPAKPIIQTQPQQIPTIMPQVNMQPPQPMNMQPPIGQMQLQPPIQQPLHPQTQSPELQQQQQQQQQQNPKVFTTEKKNFETRHYDNQQNRNYNNEERKERGPYNKYQNQRNDNYKGDDRDRPNRSRDDYNNNRRRDNFKEGGGGGYQQNYNRNNQMNRDGGGNRNNRNYQNRNQGQKQNYGK